MFWLIFDWGKKQNKTILLLILNSKVQTEMQHPGREGRSSAEKAEVHKTDGGKNPRGGRRDWVLTEEIK